MRATKPTKAPHAPAVNRKVPTFCNKHGVHISKEHPDKGLVQVKLAGASRCLLLLENGGTWSPVGVCSKSGGYRWLTGGAIESIHHEAVQEKSLPGITKWLNLFSPHWSKDEDEDQD